MMTRHRCAVIALLLVINAQGKTPKPQIEIKTSKGTLRLELTPDHTPITVDNFLAYVDAAFFELGHLAADSADTLAASVDAKAIGDAFQT